MEERYWHIISNFINGEATESEKEEFNLWLNSDPRNKALFEEEKRRSAMLLSHEETLMNFDTNQGWNRLEEKISSEDEEKKKPAHKKIKLPVYSIAAAAVLFLALGFYLLMTFGLNNSTTIATGQAQTQEITLDDGTKVSLNANSRLKLASDFNKENRSLEFTGEAFFDVSHDPDKPFIIETGQMRIKVLGTTFNVKSPKSNADQAEVFVKSGKVEVEDIDNPGNKVVVQPGFLASLNDHSFVIKENDSENYMAWKTMDLNFRNTALKNVAQDLSRAYHINIKLEEETKLENCRLTANFNDESLDNVLNTLATILGLEIERNRNEVLLKGDGCE